MAKGKNPYSHRILIIATFPKFAHICHYIVQRFVPFRQAISEIHRHFCMFCIYKML